MFPRIRNWNYPFGTKGSFRSPEEALRFGARFGNYAGKMRDFAADREAYMIGEGSVAPPPCEPQPFCRVHEGQVPSLLAITVSAPEDNPNEQWRRRQVAESFLSFVPSQCSALPFQLAFAQECDDSRPLSDVPVGP